MENLSGVLERITYTDRESGFTVIRLSVKGFSEQVVAVGNLPPLAVGSLLHLEGGWRHDRRFGRQFAISSCQESMPATLEGLKKYLGSGLIKGVGPAYAGRIVEHFGEESLQIIEENPDRLLEVRGLGKSRVEQIKEAWSEQKEIKNVMLFLQSHDVSISFATKIFKTYGQDSIAVVRENPYQLADDIWGVGFRTADKIAAGLGLAEDSPARCRAALVYTLSGFADEGHCFAERKPLIEATAKLLNLDPETIAGELDSLIIENRIFLDEDKYYLPPFFFSEAGVARKLAKLLRAGAEDVFDSEPLLEQIEKEENITYDPLQREAIKKAANSKLMVLTGGPGTGKTTTTLGIIKVLESLGKSVLLAAPTGRAAKKLAEATGREAKTIHRLLEYHPLEGYQRNAHYPLECDALIIDELSMVDIVLMYNLLKALPESAFLLMIGDVDQLPSVGAGNVLADIVAAEGIEVIALNKIFRQAEGSKIITNAHRINKGEEPILKGGKDSDFFFIEAETPRQAAELIRSLCLERLPAYYKLEPLNDIQVLTPMQKGEAGAENLNRVLQEAFNPHGTPIEYRGALYRVGDKIMQIKNNYDKNVFNGDIGTIISLDSEERTLVLSFDGVNLLYEEKELEEIRLAYATTIHKSQGSEFTAVVAPFTMQHYLLLQRNLLYTCVTRAKKLCVLVGTQKALRTALANNKQSRRNTALSARINAELQKPAFDSDEFSLGNIFHP